MLCLTCTMISSVDLARNGVSRDKDWVTVLCGTMMAQREVMLHNNHIDKNITCPVLFI